MAAGGRPTPRQSALLFKRVEQSLSGSRWLSTTVADSERMSGIGQRDTAPELAVRRAASKLGLRYTTRNRDLPGSPDLANRKRRVAIFVHGCFWHRHPGCLKASSPKTNVPFWQAKFSRNVERDREAMAALKQRGFSVVVVWECTTRDPLAISKKIAAALRTTKAAHGRLHRLAESAGRAPVLDT